MKIKYISSGKVCTFFCGSTVSQNDQIVQSFCHERNWLYLAGALMSMCLALVVSVTDHFSFLLKLDGWKGYYISCSSLSWASFR